MESEGDEMTFKCYECGHIFESGEENRWTESYGEEMSGCPICGGSYEQTKQCSICGAEHLDDELDGGVCEECIEDYRYDIDMCRKLGEKSKEDISINGFFASMYSAEEIEELIWRDMLNTQKIKAVDCTPFIEADSSWFAENLVKEVIR
jgi:DNA-directed RNA polymerase subunit RPC12/RpoP